MNRFIRLLGSLCFVFLGFILGIVYVHSPISRLTQNADVSLPISLPTRIDSNGRSSANTSLGQSIGDLERNENPEIRLPYPVSNAPSHDSVNLLEPFGLSRLPVIAIYAISPTIGFLTYVIRDLRATTIENSGQYRMPETLDEMRRYERRIQLEAENRARRESPFAAPGTGYTWEDYDNFINRYRIE